MEKEKSTIAHDLS